MPEQTISLSTVEGCMNSRSSLSSYEKMAGNLHVQHFCTKYRNNVDVIAAQVFEGISDCISRKDQPARIYRQDWDGRMWFGNERGSHRSAAVRIIDNENGFDRPIRSAITRLRISPELIEISEAHSIYLFHAGNPSILLDNSEYLAEQGIILGKHRYEKEYCFIIPKNDPGYVAVQTAMDGVFDFSDWALNPNSYDKYEANRSVMAPPLA